MVALSFAAAWNRGPAAPPTRGVRSVSGSSFDPPEVPGIEAIKHFCGDLADRHAFPDADDGRGGRHPRGVRRSRMLRCSGNHHHVTYHSGPRSEESQFWGRMCTMTCAPICARSNSKYSATLAAGM